MVTPIEEDGVREDHSQGYITCHCRFRGPDGSIALVDNETSGRPEVTILTSFDAGVVHVALPHDEVVRLKVHLDEWLTANPF